MLRFNEDNEIINNESFRAILVGVSLGEDMTRSMEELESLVEAAHGETAAVLVQNREKIEPATYLGRGKAEELREACEALEADTVVFDDELSGMQIRNLEDILGVRVIDRTILILDIFAERAVSKEGRLQVELAQLEYRRPRLMGFGRALSRQGAGIGTRGPGEKKLETDRRYIDARIRDIKKEMEHGEKTRATKRSKRTRAEIPVVALVGYTNAGKSAIMNRLLEDRGRDEKTVSSKNMLFATLDAEQRLIDLGGGREFILSDTVGFVSKLPHALIKAFKATLEEAAQADLLIHVVDVSFEEAEFNMDVTDSVLKEIGAGGKETIIAYNKCDLLAAEEEFVPIRHGILTSAKTGRGMDELLAAIESKLFGDRRRAMFLIPYDKGAALSYICERGEVFSMEHTGAGTMVDAELPEKDIGSVAGFIKGPAGADNGERSGD